MKPLTKRQKEFLEKLLDLYQKEKAPVHYSVVARHIGVGRIAAYEMLRLLEKRGFAESEFAHSRRTRGPGRARIVFRPTMSAIKTMSRLADGFWTDEDWEMARDRILLRLRSGGEESHQQVLEELLAMLPENQSPLNWLANMLALIALGLRSMKDTMGVRNLPARLRGKGLPERLDVAALMGIGFGIAKIGGDIDPAETVSSIANGYSEIISRLSAKHRKVMLKFRRDLYDLVGI